MAGNTIGDQWSFGGTSSATNTMTGTNKITGTPVLIESSHGVSWTMRWTGTPTGTFSVEVSNEYDPQTNPSPSDWTQLTLTIPSGVNPAGAYPAAGSGIDVAPTSFKWIRLCYTNSASTGVLTARCHAKGY
jgi:hypothetical protein